MKTFILLITLLPAGLLNAQNFDSIIQAFGQTDANGQHIFFTLNSEANIREYVVEESTDSLQFEITSVIASKGNTVIPRTYEFSAPSGTYSCFRVKQIDLNGIVKEKTEVLTLKTVKQSGTLAPDILISAK
jgi:hypothetical protein